MIEKVTTKEEIVEIGEMLYFKQEITIRKAGFKLDIDPETQLEDKDKIWGNNLWI